MKFIIPFLLLLFMVFPQAVSAHLAGQPPFFKVNGAYSPLYYVPLTSLEDFQLPQDTAPQNYVMGDSLHFELDETQLPAPPSVIEKTTFTWDFGDGSKGTGLKNDHKYTKSGAFILTIYADDGTVPEPQLLESCLINVFPDKNYQLPKAVIKVNGKSVTDPLTDILKMPFGGSFTFDASSSQKGTANIASYTWDFGDKQSDAKPQVVHSYPSDLTQVFPVLRVKDSNGFFGDNYLEVENQAEGFQQTNITSNQPQSTPVASNAQGSSSNKTTYVVIVGVIAVLVIVGFVFKRKKKRRHGF